MKRLAVVVLATLAVLAAAAPSAQSAPPTHERVPIDETPFIDESCDFPVEIHQRGFVIRITWVDEDGSVRRIEAFPQGRATLTNPDTGERITVNAAGPAHITDNPDGSFTLVGTGTWGWPNHPETGALGIFQLKGRFVLAVDAEATPPSASSARGSTSAPSWPVETSGQVRRAPFMPHISWHRRSWSYSP
jgi:hypothetical protein